MKLILSIYDHSVMIHVTFHEKVITYRGVIVIKSPKYQCIVHLEP